MSEASLPAACDHEHGCITCSDAGILLRVIRTARDAVTICADAEGRLAEVEVGLIEAVGEGDVLLVHAGVALLRVGGAERSLS